MARQQWRPGGDDVLMRPGREDASDLHALCRDRASRRTQQGTFKRGITIREQGSSLPRDTQKGRMEIDDRSIPIEQNPL